MAGRSVSHNVVAMLVNAAKQLDVPLAALFDGCEVDIAKLRRRRTRLHWNDFTLAFDRLCDRAGYEALEEICTRVPLIAREDVFLLSAFVDPLQLYRFVNNVMGPAMYPMLRSEFVALDDGRHRLTNSLRDDGLRDCPRFFRVLRASQAGVPCFVGLPPAHVEAETHGRGGSYWIHMPESRTLLTRLRRKARPAHEERLASELELDKKALIEAYDRLWSLNEELAGTRTRLEEELARRQAGAEATGALGNRLAAARERWQLTPRQEELLAGLVRGCANKELAESLGCSVKTVETHMTELLRRAGADSRLSLVASFWSSPLASRSFRE